ncbi:MAG: HD family phosphohydrolase [bacterium]|jgi:putative nucleotidyltransferase with HDIG domain
MIPLLGLHKQWSKLSLVKIISSYRVQRGLLGVILFLLITAILGVDFYQVDAELEIGLPSPATFAADRTVHYIDEAKTVELQANAARLVEPVYDPDVTVNNQVLAHLGQVFVTIERVLAQTDLAEDERIQELQQELSLDIPEEVYRVLVGLDSIRYGYLEKKAGQLLREFLDAGIRDYELEEAREELVEAIGDLSLTPEEREFFAAVTVKELRPNLVYNEEETEERRERARQSVQPVERTIVKDYVIVREGDPITQEHLDQLRALGIQKNGENFWVKLLGLALVVLVMLGITVGYLFLFKQKIWQDVAQLALLGMIIVGNLLVARLLTLIPNPLYGYLIPIAAGAMLVAILLDNHLAILYTVILAVFTGILTGGQLDFALVATIGGLVGAYSVSHLNQRSDLTRAGLFVAGANLLVVFAIGIFSLRSWQEVSLGVLLGIINGVAAAVLTIGSLPYLESSFRLTTAVKLLEISNPNHVLLKRLLLEAPGTYHHSILVGNLSEAAAEAVGADTLLVRAGAYYHDIGKLQRPYFFIENQVLKDNPHDKISPSLSALIITSHVKDGLELARQHRLPQVILDIIGQHHGSSLVSYFYHRALECGKEQNLSEEGFRYEGPKPQTKEAAIVMLADSVEAAVRSLARPNPCRIEGLVHKLVKERLHDGQLDECDLTFRDLDAIASAFIRVLAGIFHTRIEYPEKGEELIEGVEASANIDPKPTE